MFERLQQFLASLSGGDGKPTFAADDPRAQDPMHWQGLNLLGFALMAVRDTLAAKASGDEG